MTINAIKIQPIAPASGIQFGSVKVGRKESRPSCCSIRTIRLIVPYVARKHMVMTGAIKLRSRMKTASKTMPLVTHIPVFPSDSYFEYGISASFERACTSFGAATKVANPAQNVAPTTANPIMGGAMEISCMML